VHAQGVVHRDLKPDNCLLTEDDTLKVVDFGVSEMFQKDSDKVHKSSGSPAFMAPELCVFKHGDVSGRAADIWGMGVTLYCLRFGHVPFQRHAVLELYDSIVKDEVPIDESLGEDFVDLIRRLFEKNPVKRITMDELRVRMITTWANLKLTSFRNTHGLHAVGLTRFFRKKRTAPN